MSDVVEGLADGGSFEEGVYDCVVIGAGPAGLSAALNLSRARLRVLVVDSDRPRHAATMMSHGFLTRDGVPPHELRRLAREEVERYPTAEVLRRASVASVSVPATGVGESSHPFVTELAGGRAVVGGRTLGARTPGVTARGAAPREVRSRTVIVATGLRETLPDVPSIRAFYGMSLHSCAACDGYEQRDQPLALFGETDDLLARALLVSQWTRTLTVFTNGRALLSAADEATLAGRGIRVERGVVDELEGDRGNLEAVRLVGGRRVPVSGGFVRPLWHPALEFLVGLPAETDADGHLVVDRDGRTSVPGLYAAGDVAAPGPQQLIVAAGAGARAAAILTHDLLGVTTAH